MPQPSLLSFLGIAKETAFGTPVAATAFIPVTSLKPVDDVHYLEDKGIRGAYTNDFGYVPGIAKSTYDYDGDMFADTIGFPLASLLSDVTVTGAAAPYSTAFALLNSGNGQPSTYTISDYYVNNTRQFPGCTCSELTFKVSADALVTYSAKWTGLPSVPTTKPAPSFSGVKPVAGWTGVSKIAGAASTIILDAEWTIKRTVTPLTPVDGTQSPRNLWAGPVNCSGKLTVIAEDDSQLSNYLQNSQPALDFTFAAGTGSTATSVELHTSQAAYTMTTTERGKDYIEAAVTFNAVANTTDVGSSAGLSPCKVTIQNANPTGTYK